MRQGLQSGKEVEVRGSHPPHAKCVESNLIQELLWRGHRASIKHHMG